MSMEGEAIFVSNREVSLPRALSARRSGQPCARTPTRFEPVQIVQFSTGKAVILRDAYIDVSLAVHMPPSTPGNWPFRRVRTPAPDAPPSRRPG